MGDLFSSHCIHTVEFIEFIDIFFSIETPIYRVQEFRRYMVLVD